MTHSMINSPTCISHSHKAQETTKTASGSSFHTQEVSLPGTPNHKQMINSKILLLFPLPHHANTVKNTKVSSPKLTRVCVRACVSVCGVTESAPLSSTVILLSVLRYPPSGLGITTQQPFQIQGQAFLFSAYFLHPPKPLPQALCCPVPPFLPCSRPSLWSSPACNMEICTLILS